MSRLKSILFLKCPRCRKGNLLKAQPYHLMQFNKVNKNCPNCELHFNIEPGFFFGSMYVSYGIGVGIGVAVFIVLLLLGISGNLVTNFIVMSIILILLMPYINALSKVIWANFFFKFDTKYSQ
jgi:uncharacterized protein (DUF983 family)